MASVSGIVRAPQLKLTDKIWRLHTGFILLLLIIGLVGYGMLYSAAGGEHSPWAWRHAVRFALGLGVMIIVALIDIRIWFRFAYWIYGLAFLALGAVELVGSLNKGAQRWIDLGIIQVQPSEVMKIALVLALARFFHSAYLEEVKRPLFLTVPLLLTLVPAALVLKQPDLGTAIMLLAGAGAIFFLAGVRWWKFAAVIGAAAAALPIIWQQLHDYQRQRVLTFLNPERDPLGAGYHIIQSKIALGSGGVWGKGFLGGTQSQLSFLPEKQTDFVFTMLAEEAGLVGGLSLISLYMAVFLLGLLFAARARSQFARLLTAGVSITFFLYVAINVAMVTGLIPVVGVPLPLVSYGGTAMLTVMFGCGLMLSVEVHQEVAIHRFPTDDW
ncbi:MAG: rod shape-determining protein RodA [Geminicoccaceae bacterium]